MKITVEIDCGEKTCDSCKFVYETLVKSQGHCKAYEYDLTPDGTGTFKRLPECIAACKMEGKNA